MIIAFHDNREFKQSFFYSSYRILYAGLSCLLWTSVLSCSLLWALRVGGFWTGCLWFVLSCMGVMVCGNATTIRFGYDFKSKWERFFDSTMEDVVSRRLGYIFWWLALVPSYRSYVLPNAVLNDQQDLVEKILKKPIKNKSALQNGLLASLYPERCEHLIPVLFEKALATGGPYTTSVTLSQALANLLSDNSYLLRQDAINLCLDIMEKLRTTVLSLTPKQCQDWVEASPHCHFLSLRVEADVSTTKEKIKALRSIKEDIISSCMQNPHLYDTLRKSLGEHHDLAQQSLIHRMPNARWKVNECEQTYVSLLSLMDKQRLNQEVYASRQEKASVAKPIRKM